MTKDDFHKSAAHAGDSAQTDKGAQGAKVVVLAPQPQGPRPPAPRPPMPKAPFGMHNVMPIATSLKVLPTLVSSHIGPITEESEKGKDEN